MKKINFTPLTDDGIEKYWISEEEFYEPEIDFRLALRITDLKSFVDYADEEWLKQGKWQGEILVVSPSYAGTETMRKAHDFMGDDDNDNIDSENTIENCETLLYFGLYAPVISTRDNSVNKLIKKLTAIAPEVRENICQYLDYTYNNAGSVGWDFLGNIETT